MTGKSTLRKIAIRLIQLAIGVGLVTVAGVEIHHWYHHVYEPNAIIEADFTLLSSSVDGNVQRIHVRRGDRVTEGQRLASMDSAVAELEVKSLRADLEKERASRNEIEAELVYFKIELADRMRTAAESVKQLRNNEITLLQRLDIAEANVERNNKLLRNSVVPRQQIDDANDKLLEVTSNLRDLQTRIKLAEKRLDELRGQTNREEVFKARVAVSDRNIDKLAILLAQSEELSRKMHIYSPIDGVVNEIHVNPGAYVENGDPVFLLHAPNALWVEAYVDESEIRHVSVGQEVVIDIDAYPYEHFTGKVRAIGQVTLSMMDAEKRQRKTSGAAQQIPVIIDLPAIERPVWPGMRAAVNIVIR